MNDFAAIDFETANSHRKSVCSVGIVIVKNQKVSDTFYELIRPAPNYYCDWATEIHGLTYHDTAHADPFPVVWQKNSPGPYEFALGGTQQFVRRGLPAECF